MLHLFTFGLLLGWGAAIPIGAINLEIIRRNLRFGTPTGFALGLGACSADVTYLVLLSLGVLHILTYPAVLKYVGLVGSLILGWFGIAALRLKSTSSDENISTNLQKSPFGKNLVEGYLLTLVNPFTILFWSSVSMTIATTTHAAPHAVIYAGLGVLIGTVSWITGLNLLLHFTRHKLSGRAMQIINYAGGIILLGFAAMGVWRAIG